MCLEEAKAKKLEPIKQCLKMYTNYQIESINDGFIKTGGKTHGFNRGMKARFS